MIADRGTPKVFNDAELKSFGFKSSNDRSMTRVLKDLKILDERGVPNENWTALRNKSTRAKTLGSLVQNCYTELYERLPNAHSQSDETIADVIAANSSLGKDAVTKAVQTFKSLVGVSEFTASSEINDEGQGPVIADVVAPDGRFKNQPQATGRNTTINLSLNLHFPENASQEAIDAIFSSMKKNLLDG